MLPRKKKGRIKDRRNIIEEKPGGGKKLTEKKDWV